MKPIVIKPKNKEEEKLLKQLFEKMNIESHNIEEPVPNYETQQAMKDVETGKGNYVENSNQLFSELDI